MNSLLKKLKEDFPKHKFKFKKEEKIISHYLIIDGKRTNIDFIKENTESYNILKLSVKYLLGDKKLC